MARSVVETCVGAGLLGAPVAGGWGGGGGRDAPGGTGGLVRSGRSAGGDLARGCG